MNPRIEYENISDTLKTLYFQLNDAAQLVRDNPEAALSMITNTMEMITNTRNAFDTFGNEVAFIPKTDIF